MDPTDYATRPVYRSPTNYKKVYPSSTMHRNWKSFFDHNNVICTKVTHQPRVDLQQRIMDKGCELSQLERFCGYKQEGNQKMNQNQKKSYLHCPPVQAVAAAADGDPCWPESHCPGWEADLPLGPNGCLQSLISLFYF